MQPRIARTHEVGEPAGIQISALREVPDDDGVMKRKDDRARRGRDEPKPSAVRLAGRRHGISPVGALMVSAAVGQSRAALGPDCQSPSRAAAAAVTG